MPPTSEGDDEWDVRVDLARAQQQLLDADSDGDERTFAGSVALDITEDHKMHKSDK